ncbi:acrylyl-CoA reductase (NADPH) [Sphingopyxis sp. FD7]|uniref:acrylyl-CoA reductase (NADPH) n=1 Tax=Sphingopyxis sp. FD7 TaxID=1914525 RepID=UPI000DC6174D|nr:MDR family oxidoreductase [Sphingopyxis sp. FD7]BBB14006.1 alcohol dehydrogenase [Sphingopyxis sp. FD7]
MSAETFPAIIIDREGDGQKVSFRSIDETALPPGNTLVRVEASTVNYKDGLLLSGAIPLIQSFPMVPGIDLAGIVEWSDHPRWRPGDRVIANGWGLGERHWGGYAGKCRLDGDWLVACPDRFSAKQAMAIGTAGYTAMLCVLALERQGVQPDDGEILVTGASGGVGSIAISLLARRGYRVVAATGRLSEEPYLRHLGAASLIDRAEFAQAGAPLQKERWAGAIDTAGSHMLANICASLRYGGTVAATGIAQGADFPATMYPLALRGITICGVDSVHAAVELRQTTWKALAAELDLGLLKSMTNEIALADVIEVAPTILAGGVRGRIVVEVGT